MEQVITTQLKCAVFLLLSGFYLLVSQVSPGPLVGEVLHTTLMDVTFSCLLQKGCSFAFRLVLASPSPIFLTFHVSSL